MLAVAELLQRRRAELGYSLEQLADDAGLHRTSVGLIMRGQRGVTVASAANLARALGVTLSELVAQAEART
jgi:transcriptional regulator with XRE-family HTH domain